MSVKQLKDGIVAGRLSGEEIEINFKDLHAPLDSHEAVVEADRCYFCHDAPCMTACPTAIDIPMFIRQIATGNPIGSAKTIFDQNILGGMCARVCPTETLCEQVCVRETAEGKPVKIGQLQRYSTDIAMKEARQFYQRASSTGKKIAIVGAGPAGLACAHRLACYGHDLTVYESKSKSGGLNEFGIAAYKTVDDFAQSEVDYVTAIGGITIKHDQLLGQDIYIEELTNKFDAVFLSVGLAGVNKLGGDNNGASGDEDAVTWIANLRQAKDLTSIPIGKRIVVIGGGMTAIDVATQSKALGADEVVIAYRGPKEKMKASIYEQEVAQTRDVTIRYNMNPKNAVVTDGKIAGFEFDREGEDIVLGADQVMKAIGQTLEVAHLENGKTNIKIENGRIKTDDEGKTSNAKIWAGGDCTNHGDELTVTAVAQGRDAAESINVYLTEGDK